MAAQGATLQNYNSELVNSIEDLRGKREELNRQILHEEEDKGKVREKCNCRFCTRRRKMEKWGRNHPAAVELGFINWPFRSLPSTETTTATTTETFQWSKFKVNNLKCNTPK
jgi:hypothetical protein